ncbi:MAG: efflux RND transporter periplasmic adaptor subunit [Opitutaceae bacterium]|nr:efflux RND transporter periplasmic adaptor subunit [Opitutaceae bacterium]
MSTLTRTSCALALGAAVAFAAGCSKKAPAATAENTTASADAAQKPAEDPNAAKAADAVPVEIETARIGPVAAFLSYNSTIEVETAVDVYPETTGLVEKLLVEEGDRVKAGQILLQLEQDEQVVEVKDSEVNLARLESTFNRSKELSERGLINAQEFESKRFDLEQARLRLERARIGLENTTVRAPVDGVVTERFVQPGARVAGGTKLFALMSLDDMIARVHVPGRYLDAVSEQQEARLASDFLPGRSFDGWVKRISPVVDPKSGTFKVTVGVRPGSEAPRPGLFVNVRIITDRRDAATLVPKRAVVYDGGERYVFIVRDGKAARVRLAAGYEEGEAVEAVSDVTAGDMIVVLGQNALKDQSPVRVVNLPAAAAIPATATAEAAPAPAPSAGS